MFQSLPLKLSAFLLSWVVSYSSIFSSLFSCEVQVYSLVFCYYTAKDVALDVTLPGGHPGEGAQGARVWPWGALASEVGEVWWGLGGWGHRLHAHSDVLPGLLGGGVIQAIKPWPHHTYFLNVNESGEVLCMWILSWAHFGIMKVFTWLDPFPETVGPKSLICQMNMFKNSFIYEEYPSSLVILNVIYLIDI